MSRRINRDIDDILGDDDDEDFSLRTAEVHSVVAGVTIPWLSKAFRMGRATIEKKLRGCAPVGSGKHGTPIYDLPEAAAYLVDPRVDLETYLASLKPDQLPERLREGFWNAKLKEQRFRERAKDLWRSEDVLAAMGDIFTQMRTILQILPDDIDRANPLTPMQRVTVTAVIDGLQDRIHKDLVEYSNGRRTMSQLSEVDDPKDDEEEDLIG